MPLETPSYLLQRGRTTLNAHGSGALEHMEISSYWPSMRPVA